jgi:fatty-acyl-CoA synthase
VTLSYAHGVSDTPLLGETIGDNLRRTVERVPDAEALVVRSQQFRATYRQLWELTARAARGLLAKGVAVGDRVGLWCPNRYEWVVAQFAAARVGAILVNVNPAYRAAELEYALNKSGVSVLLHARGFRSSDFVRLLAEVRPRCPELRERVIIDDEWGSFLAAGDRVPASEMAAREAVLQFDDPINIQYTSGTTGFPKAATLSHHNVLNNAFFTGQMQRLTERDRVCVPVPFYHCFGMVLGTLACSTHGACMVVPGEGFDPASTIDAVTAERCTALYGVPTMFIAVLEHPNLAAADVASLRTGIMAGSPCPVATMRAVRERLNMTEVTIGYGMTETSPLSTQTAPEDPVEKRVGTVGRVHPHVEVKIIDPATGRVIPRGGRGELCTRGYGVMAGYWADPEATRAVLDSHGWMHTGDLATMDADGYVNVVGRLKDIVIRGGENIAPREVEEFLQSHPAVGEAQVIGVPSERYGEEVMAWVRLKAGATASADELIAHCRRGLAAFKVPKFWKFVDAFPLTVTGKVQKRVMREAAVAELNLSAAAEIETA